MGDGKDLRAQLEEIVSPSDIPLFDIIAANVDAITSTVQVFKDRNPIPATSALVLGVIQTIIAFTCGVSVDTSDLRHFIVEQSQKGQGKND